MVKAAQKITTGSGPLREQFERIAKRRGRKIACRRRLNTHPLLPVENASP
jgi:hypothetical protein